MNLENLSAQRHRENHRPQVNGRQVEPVPYLALPFRRADLGKEQPYTITEGWQYSMHERGIHGLELHGGVDYAVDYGTPVVAPCDGVAIASYHGIYLPNRSGALRKFQDKEVGLGLGLFVQIWTPDNRIVQLAHLSSIDDKIPFSLPEQDEHDPFVWTPQNHTLNRLERVTHQLVVPVRKGEPIGAVGTSGLRWGKYQELVIDNGRPRIIEKAIGEWSWDEPHLHFEEAERDEQTGVKGGQRDPYDIYLTGRRYPTHTKPLPMGPEPLFELDKSGLPKFAEEVSI